MSRDTAGTSARATGGEQSWLRSHWDSSLVIVSDLYVIGAFIGPNEANSVLVINAYTLLPFPITPKCFQVVSRRYTQIVKGHSSFELIELPDSYPFNSPELARSTSFKEYARFFVFEIRYQRI